MDCVAAGFLKNMDRDTRMEIYHLAKSACCKLQEITCLLGEVRAGCEEVKSLSMMALDNSRNLAGQMRVNSRNLASQMHVLADLHDDEESLDVCMYDQTVQELTNNDSQFDGNAHTNEEIVDTRELSYSLVFAKEEADTRELVDTRELSHFPALKKNDTHHKDRVSGFETTGQHFEVENFTHDYEFPNKEDMGVFLVLPTWFRFEEYDPFWIYILQTIVKVRERIALMEVVPSGIKGLFLDLSHGLHLKFKLKGGHIFMEQWVRDYDGYNGPGFAQGSLAFVRDYDGFNGPGNLEDKVVLRVEECMSRLVGLYLLVVRNKDCNKGCTIMLMMLISHFFNLEVKVLKKVGYCYVLFSLGTILVSYRSMGYYD